MGVNIGVGCCGVVVSGDRVGGKMVCLVDGLGRVRCRWEGVIGWDVGFCVEW